MKMRGLNGAAESGSVFAWRKRYAVCTFSALRSTPGSFETCCKTAWQAERWGFPREYTEKRLEQLQSVGDAHPDQEGRKESESGQHCQFSIWQKYGNASRIVLDNSTLILNKHGNESLFMTPTRPASFQGLRPSQFLLVGPCPHLPAHR